ncbi:MAG: hypothetical protein ABIP48_12310 [Planctomycetota bacterium]
MTRDEILRDLAAGKSSVEEAARLLDQRDLVYEQLLRFVKKLRFVAAVYPIEKFCDYEWVRDLDLFPGCKAGSLVALQHKLTKHTSDRNEDVCCFKDGYGESFVASELISRTLANDPKGIYIGMRAESKLQVPSVFGFRTRPVVVDSCVVLSATEE